MTIHTQTTDSIFSSHCEAAAKDLAKLHGLAEKLEEDVAIVYEDRAGMRVLTHVVQNLYEARGLTEALMSAHLPVIAEYEKAVADIIKLTVDAVVKKIATLQDEFECMVRPVKKTQRFEEESLQAAASI